MLNEAAVERAVERMLQQAIQTGVTSCCLPTAGGCHIVIRMGKFTMPVPAGPGMEWIKTTVSPKVQPWSATDCAQQRFQSAYDAYVSYGGDHQHRHSHKVARTTITTRKLPEYQNAIHRIRSSIIELSSLKLCECKEGLILDNGDMCFTCSMQLTEEELSKHECPICFHQADKFICQTSCCKQWIHDECLRKSVQATQSCPFCRRQL